MSDHDTDLDLLTPPEAATALRKVSPRTLERWRTSGTGPAFVRLGRRVAYRRCDLAKFVAANRVLHTAKARR